jgi:hypothetical protein
LQLYLFLDLKRAGHLCRAVGESVEVGNFDPKYAAFWVEEGKFKRILIVLHFVFAFPSKIVSYCAVFLQTRNRNYMLHIVRKLTSNDRLESRTRESVSAMSLRNF